jgi:hypothetical protein
MIFFTKRYIAQKSDDLDWVHGTVKHINTIFRKSYNMYIQICNDHFSFHEHTSSFIIRHTSSQTYFIASNNSTLNKRSCCRCCNYFKTKPQQSVRLMWPFTDDCNLQLEAVLVCLFMLAKNDTIDECISHYERNICQFKTNHANILPFLIDAMYPNCTRTRCLLKTYFELYVSRHPIVGRKRGFY